MLMPRLTSQSTDLVLHTAKDGTQVTMPAPKPEAVEEDRYADALDSIIKRDFFPDLHKLDSQLEWLEAVERHDVKKMMEIRAKYASRKRKGGPGNSQATPRPFATPNFSDTPLGGPLGGQTPITAAPDFVGEFSAPKRCKLNDNDVEGSTDPTQSGGFEKDSKNLRLDAFTTKYTSEDNESFGELMAKTAAVNEKRFWWLYKTKEGDEHHDKQQFLLGPAPDKGGVKSWDWDPRNSLMYVPDALPQIITGDEAKQADKEVVLNNTRFVGNLPWEEAKKAKDAEERAEALRRDRIAAAAQAVPGGHVQIDAAQFIMARKAQMMSKKFDLDEIRATPKRQNPVGGYSVPDSPQVRGYGFVTTPSPMPGRDTEGGVDPIMTWGEIEGTPLLLDPTDTPLDVTGKDGGPAFKMQISTSREDMALALANKASKNLAKKAASIGGFATPLHRATTILRRGAAVTPLLHQAAPGKLSVAEKVKAINSSMDSQLRASYASPMTKRPNSISRRSSGAATPTTKPKTPAVARTTTSQGQPAPAAPKPTSSITDDLM